MTEQNKVKHGMCIAVLPKRMIRNPVGLIEMEIEKLLEPFGPVPELGPRKFTAQDITPETRDLCFDFVRSVVADFKDKQAIRSAIHVWCEKNDIKLADPKDAENMDASWDPGIYAFISELGVSHVFEVRTRVPKILGWKLGGFWAGSLQLLEDVDVDVYGQPKYVEPWHSSESAIELAANTDIALSQDVDWSWPHTTGPKISLIKSLESRFKQNDLTAKHQLPYAILARTSKGVELITKNDWDTSGAALLKSSNKLCSWDDYVAKFYSKMSKHAGSITCVLDLEVKDE